MKHIVYFFFLSISLGASAQVWFHDENKSWNENVEIQYSRWVAVQVGTDFLTRDGEFYSHMEIDCADFQYLLRLVFARNNNLEFAINDPQNPGQIISSRSQRWQNVKDLNLRAKQFYSYVADVTSTQTLPNDTVLIALTKEELRPGVILLGDKARGHSMVIKSFRPSGIPVLLYGSLPAKEFIYPSYNFPDPLSYFPMGSLGIAKGGGLRRFKWPQDLNRPLASISYSSNDQLTVGRDLKIFFDYVQSIKRQRPHTPDENLNYLIDDLCAQVRVRVNTVTDAINFLEKNRHRRLTFAEDDRFSTFKRDENIRVLIKKLKNEKKFNLRNFTESTRERLENVLVPAGNTHDECIIDWAENRQEPLGWIIERFEVPGRVSSQGNGTLSQRWGL